MTTDHAVADESYDQCNWCDCPKEDRPPCYWKLAAERPEGWGPNAPAVSLGIYCSIECARWQPTATLADAQAMFERIDRYLRGPWQRLLDAYPEPVEIGRPEEGLVAGAGDYLERYRAWRDRPPYAPPPGVSPGLAERLRPYYDAEP